MTFFLIFLVAAWAGAQNALAGGGSFLILPTLMFGARRAGGQHHLLRRAVSGSACDRLDGPRPRGRRRGPFLAGALCNQRSRRGVWRGDPALDALGLLCAPRAL